MTQGLKPVDPSKDPSWGQEYYAIPAVFIRPEGELRAVIDGWLMSWEKGKWVDVEMTVKNTNEQSAFDALESANSPKCDGLYWLVRETVCDACGQKGCWEGAQYCEDYRAAGTKEQWRLRPVEDFPASKLIHQRCQCWLGSGSRVDVSGMLMGHYGLFFVENSAAPHEGRFCEVLKEDVR